MIRDDARWTAARGLQRLQFLFSYLRGRERPLSAPPCGTHIRVLRRRTYITTLSKSIVDAPDRVYERLRRVLRRRNQICSRCSGPASTRNRHVIDFRPPSFSSGTPPSLPVTTILLRLLRGNIYPIFHRISPYFICGGEGRLLSGRYILEGEERLRLTKRAHKHHRVYIMTCRTKIYRRLMSLSLRQTAPQLPTMHQRTPIQ